MSELGDSENPVGLAWGRGIPEAVAETIIPARYNALDVLRRIFERDGDDIAGVIIEPVLGNAQAIMPQPGFHEAIRALTEEFGSVLIFDEVKTGFRFARGGAAEYFGVTPDLATYAKAIGNGYPAAAFGGSEEVMSVLPDHVSHGGTYAGNRVAAAAAVKTLTILKETDALETDPRHRAPASRPSIGDDPRPARARLHVHRAPVDVRHLLRRAGADRVPRLGHLRPRAVRRDRDRDARRAARCRSRTRASRGSCARPTPRATTSTGSLSIFADSLDAALEGRAHGDDPEARRRGAGPHGRGLTRDRRWRWHSTATPSARSTGPPRSCWRSATARARRA